MNKLNSQVRWLAHSRTAVIWGVLAALAGLTAINVYACLWRTRPPPDPLAATMTQLATLDSSQRQKVCAHRSNNVPKYRAAGKIFDCIEMDVVLDPPAGGPPAVYHPPAENNHGLSLRFLLTNEGLPRGKLWLDVKDLAQDNWAPFLDLLTELVPPERRPDVIVETSWSDSTVRAAAAAFRDKGFLVSYYLPTDEALACGVDVSAACNDLRSEVLQATELGFSHLSFDARAREFVDTIRGRLAPSVRLLTWDLSETWSERDLIDGVDVYIVIFPDPFTT